MLWALATDQNHGPHVGGCDTCRGLVTIDTSDPGKATVKPKRDYYVLGQASKFVLPGAVRIASDEPAGTQLKDVAFRNPERRGRAVHVERRNREPGPSHRLPRKNRGHHPACRISGHVCLEAVSGAFSISAAAALCPRAAGPEAGADLSSGGNHERLRAQVAAMAGAAGHRRAGAVDLATT